MSLQTFTNELQSNGITKMFTSGGHKKKYCGFTL